MKRQIKCRALELDTGNWVYGGFVSIDGYAMSNGVPDLNEPVTRYYIFQDGERREVAEETVGQFTGLLDKNGVEIYEGDVVSGWKYDPDKFHVVVYDADKYSCGFMARNTIGQGSIHVWYENLEVIGNIHNNPELLEK